GSRAAERHAGRRGGAEVPGRAGLVVGRRRRAGLRGDDQPPGAAARAPDRRGAVLDADARARGARVRRHRQGAVPDRRRTSGRERPDALPRRSALRVRLLAIRVPADLHVLRYGHDEVRTQPHAGRDRRPGAALPPHRAAQPPRVHGHGRAADEPRQRAGRRPPPARHRDHPSPHGDLDRRLGAGHPGADRVRRARAPGALAARPRGRAALADHAGQRPLPDRRGARRLPRVLREAPAPRVRRVRDAGGGQRRPRAGGGAGPAAGSAHPQGQPDPVQPHGVDLRRLVAQRDRALPGGARGARAERDGPPHARARHRRRLRPAGGASARRRRLRGGGTGL
ncbi:MAG: 23S rRNA (adenine(2503)-C(2))-methyltransferase @ tRNA (adenine(37)-C(2))-methyltransferase, partial [uncultured Solirubrobacteraceae bacterium]